MVGTPYWDGHQRLFRNSGFGVSVANAGAEAVSVALSQWGASTGVTQWWQELVRPATKRVSVSRLTGGKRESIRLGRDAFGRWLMEMPAVC